MDNEYTSMWQFLIKSPAGKLMIATGVAMGIAAAYACTLNPTEQYENNRSYIASTNNQPGQGPNNPEQHKGLTALLNK